MFALAFAKQQYKSQNKSSLFPTLLNMLFLEAPSMGLALNLHNIIFQAFLQFLDA